MILLSRRIAVLLFLLLPVFWGCAARVPKGLTESRALLEQTRTRGDDKILPAEYRNIEETILMGEGLLKEGEDEEAERLFLLAWSKGLLLQKKLDEEKARLRVEMLKREEAERLEAERKRLQLIEEQQRIAEEKQLEDEKKRKEKEKPERERPLPPYYTVKRGETLPQIAARTEIYNDQTLWPLIYRANRDQIRDPRFISPGQVLRIPRNVSRDDIAEARRFSAGKSFH